MTVRFPSQLSRYASVLGFLLLLPPAGSAAGSSDPEAALRDWQTSHGSSWRMILDERTGRVRFLHGGAAASAAVPRSDAEWFELARAWVAASQPLHGIDLSTLDPAAVRFLPLGLAGSNDKWTVAFREGVAGVPVEGGHVEVLFDANARLLSIDSTGLPELEGFATSPLVPGTSAVRHARVAFRDLTGLTPTDESAPELVILQHASAGRRSPRLSWRIHLLARMPGTVPEGETLWIDARDGSLLSSAPNVHTFDVSGNVKSLASPGDRPDVSDNAETPHEMVHLEVTSAQGSAVTDASGDFTIAGAVPPAELTVRYVGPFATVINAAGGNHVLTQIALAETGNDILMNPLADPLTTAQANAFRWINNLRDWTRATNPLDATADFQALANVNLPGPCNAFWTNAGGGSVNFFIENLCVNSAYSTVVVHEMGHWLNQEYNSGNGADGFGEGNADVYAMYVLNTSIVGRDFEGTGTKIRDGHNMRQFCGDSNPGCYGEVHTDGEVLMGALWKVRERLQDDLGQQIGGLTADVLFNSWMNAYNDGQIKSIIEIHWLTLDDDDGDIDNGTPHYLAIDGAFRIQGFPGFDLDCAPPQSYCSSAPNSQGPGVFLDHAGTTSIANNDLVLFASGGPPNKSGLFYYGQVETQVALGNGFRCIGGQVFRLPLLVINAQGDASQALDLDDLPAGGEITVGDVKRFQFWYRDPAGGGAFFNLSDALRVEFCP